MNRWTNIEMSLCRDPVSIALIGLAAGGLGISAASAAGAFQSGDKPPGPDYAGARKRAEEARRARLMAQGRESTILGGSSSPQGSVGTQTLLGGD